MYRDHRLLLDAATAHDFGLNGRIAPADNGDLVCGSDGNVDRVAALHAYWRHAHPEAGPKYWSARSWSQLIWQPIYLTVLAVHVVGLVPRLSRFGQSHCEGAVSGFSLTTQHGRALQPSAPIDLPARQLRSYLARQWQETAAVFPIHAKMANRLAADYLLAALLKLQRILDLGNEPLRDLAACWLNKTGMAGCSSLIDVRLDDGRDCLALDRTVCCQHFRREDGSPCSTCPRLDAQQRIILLKKELCTAC